jgi:hypothetical protein
MLLQLTIILLRISEWLHRVGMRYGGRSFTLFNAPRQPKYIWAEPVNPDVHSLTNGYATCSVCYTGMQPQMASKKTPPKFAIANGFVIGSFPQEIKFYNKEGQRAKRKVEDDELADTLKAMVAPLRPYSCVFAYSGGAQKSLRGNYQFFEMDQNRLGG